MEYKEEIKNPELLTAMETVRKENTEENMLEVLKYAVPAKFILPVDGSEEGKLKFHAVKGSDDKIYQVVYADTLSFNKTFGDKKQKGMVAGFMDLTDLVLDPQSKTCGFVINPGTHEVIFGKEMISAIVEQFKKEGINVGRAEQQETKGPSSIKVGDPQRLPDGLGNSAIEFGSSHEVVIKIFIQLMQREGKDVPEWLFIIDHTGRNDEVFKEFAECVGPFLDGLSMVMIDMGDPIADKVIEGKVPVYVR